MPIHNSGTKGAFLIASATANLTANTAQANVVGETVDSMVISQLAWSVDSSNKWTLVRGSNTTNGNTIAVLHGSGDVDFQTLGLKLETAEEAADMYFRANTGGTGFISVRLKKTSTFVDVY
jgi:hypothetical protein